MLLSAVDTISVVKLRNDMKKWQWQPMHANVVENHFMLCWMSCDYCELFSNIVQTNREFRRNLCRSFVCECILRSYWQRKVMSRREQKKISLYYMRSTEANGLPKDCVYVCAREYRVTFTISQEMSPRNVSNLNTIADATSATLNACRDMVL